MPGRGDCKPREGVRLWRNPASGSVRGRLARPEHNPGSVAAPGGVIGAVAAEGKAGGYRIEPGNTRETFETAWQQGHPGWRVVEDSALDGLPDEGAVWLFGWENAFLDELAVGGDLALDAGAQKLTLAGEEQAGVSVALATGGPERPIGWVVAPERSMARNSLRSGAAAKRAMWALTSTFGISKAAARR